MVTGDIEMPRLISGDLTVSTNSKLGPPNPGWVEPSDDGWHPFAKIDRSTWRAERTMPFVVTPEDQQARTLRAALRQADRLHRQLTREADGPAGWKPGSQLQQPLVGLIAPNGDSTAWQVGVVDAFDGERWSAENRLTIHDALEGHRQFRNHTYLGSIEVAAPPDTGLTAVLYRAADGKPRVEQVVSALGTPGSAQRAAELHHGLQTMHRGRRIAGGLVTAAAGALVLGALRAHRDAPAS